VLNAHPPQDVAVLRAYDRAVGGLADDDLAVPGLQLIDDLLVPGADFEQGLIPTWSGLRGRTVATVRALIAKRCKRHDHLLATEEVKEPSRIGDDRRRQPIEQVAVAGGRLARCR